MEQIVKITLEYWATWIFGLISAGLLTAYRRLAKRVKEDEAERKAIKAGLLAILHDRIYQACQRYLEQGWIDTSGLRNIECLYRNYHALGGNGTGTELYTRAKSLPIKDN